MRVDTHVHLLPEAYRRTLRERELVPWELPPWSAEMTDAFMADHAIDAAVLSLAPPGVHFGDAGLAGDPAPEFADLPARARARLDAGNAAALVPRLLPPSPEDPP